MIVILFYIPSDPTFSASDTLFTEKVNIVNINIVSINGISSNLYFYNMYINLEKDKKGSYFPLLHCSLFRCC